MDEASVADAFARWMRTKRDAPFATLEKYARLSRSWVDFLPTPPAERTVDDVEAWVARPRRGTETPKPATVRNELAVLGTFYRWGQARYGWPANPAALAGRPKVRNRQPRPVPDDLWLRVWLNDDLPLDARVALGLGYYCGLRRSEITTLRGEQVWGGALVNFTRKGGGEDRFDYSDVLDHWTAFLPDFGPERLREPLVTLARTRGSDALMPWGPWVSREGLNKRMSKWLAQCELQSDAFTPHQLRHSFATNLLRTGVPLDVACDLCNHSSVNVTMRYVKTSGGRLAALRHSSLTRAEAM